MQRGRQNSHQLDRLRGLFRWAARLIAFKPAHRAQVLAQVEQFVPPPQARVSWTVHRLPKGSKTIAEWKQRWVA